MYQDYYYDKELGMYNINNRFYLPDINGFLIPDSVGNIDIKDIGNLNLYTYSNNNPINGCYKDKLDESKPSNSTVNTITPYRTVLVPKFKTWSNIGGGLSVFLNVAGNVVDGLDSYSMISGLINDFRKVLKLDEIKIFDYIDYGLIIFESLYKTRSAVINNLLNSSMPLELRIGYSLTDALYFFAEGFISILCSLACSYYPFVGPLIEVPVNDYFLDLLEKRWKKTGSEEFYNKHFTIAVIILFNYLKKCKPTLL